MQGFNHVAGGVAFTGIFASFAEVNIFEKPEYIAATVGFSLLADIDHKRSWIGVAVGPVSTWINRKFGHRTVTHSFVFTVGLIAVVSGIERIFHESKALTIIALFAYSSHLIFDMCTKSGIALFWPFTTRPAVLPGNPNLRLSATDLRSEAIVFLVFLSLIWFCQPLFANGFWTSMNKVFLSGKHINREFQGSKDLLMVNFQPKGKSTDSAYLIQPGDLEMILFRDGKFIKVNPNEVDFKDFRHTHKKLNIVQKTLFQASAVEVQKLVIGPCTKLQIQSTSHRLNWFEGPILKTGNEIEAEYKSGFTFTIETKPDIEAETRHRILLADIAQKKQDIEHEKQEVLLVRNSILSLERSYDSASDFRKGKIIEELTQLRSELKQLEHQEITNVDKELAELGELQKQMNRPATVSANVLTLEIR